MSTEADIVERARRSLDPFWHHTRNDVIIAMMAEIKQLRAERDAAARHKDRADLLLAAARSAAAQCGNVIYNCRQVPADNERHLASWESVHRHLEGAIHLAADTKAAPLMATEKDGAA